MTSKATGPNTATSDDPFACVEDGRWVPLPAQPRDDQLRLHLKDVDPDESHAVKQRGVMTVHLLGCSGDVEHPKPQRHVAEALARQAADPNCFGGAAGAVASSFFFHLGDIAYKGEDKSDPKHNDQALLYDRFFYGPYSKYPKEIFAIAGNHDGKDGEHDEAKSAIHHFLLNFCDTKRRPSPDDRTDGRRTMNQPYPYWLLETPVAHVLGLYTNDVNGGQLDDPQGHDRPQYRWLVETLRQLGRAADGKALLLAVHYPPYSAATNFAQRGDPTLGPTLGAAGLRPLALILQEAYRESGQYPDAVLSAHAHLYQRLTYTHADGRQVPHLIVGSGGHAPVEGLGAPCAKGSGVAPGVAPAAPAEVALPPWLPLPAGDRVRLEAYDDEHFGFLRLTLDANQKTLTGEFFAVLGEAGKVSGLSAVADHFTLDLRAHGFR
jgi:hypothetical protein